jgi:hypothetical protein
MTRSILALLVTLAALQPCAYSQCTDSSTVAASNYYLIKGAQAREDLALCIEYRKIDAEVIAQQDKIQSKLLDELQKRDERYKKLKRITTGLAVALLLFIFV